MATQVPPSSLPGGKSPIPTGMATYVVHFASRPEMAAAKGRRAFYKAGLAEARAFKARLTAALDAKGLSQEVASFGEELGLPVVVMTCTPQVAKFVETLDDVQAVVQDSSDIGLATTESRSS